MTKLLPAQTLRISGAAPGDRVRQTGTFADACQFGAAWVCVARQGCPGRNATRRSLQVYASSLLLSGMCPVGRKLLRLMRKFQQSSETATKCCGDGKVHWVSVLRKFLRNFL